MLKSNESLKLVSKIAATMAILVLASACTHQQLKDEADVAAIEDTGSIPTPDIETPAADPLAASTPIPGDFGQPSRVSTPRHAKHFVTKHATKHRKTKHHAAHLGKKKKTKTMVATRGSVDAQVPPAPPAPPTIGEEAVMPAPPVPTDALATPVDLGSDSQGGHGLIISLAILGLGALAFAGVRLRRSRGSRRLVFN